MINPKKTFQETAEKERWKWQDLMDGTPFQTGASAAMAQMQVNTPMAKDPDDAAAMHWRMVGARDFLQTLMALNDKPTENKPAVTRKQLDHNA